MTQEIEFGSVLRIEHEENIKGMDFIVGDLHGSVHLLEKFFKLHGFDEDIDRLFSVGDLVDRGKDSLKTLGLLKKNWFFPVLGNHEQMFFSHAKSLRDGYDFAFLMNGGDWYERIPFQAPEYEEMQSLADLLPWIPCVRTIKGKNKVHIIHAEFNVRHVELTDENIENEETLKKMCMLSSMDGEYSFWGRALFNPLYNTDPTEIDISKEIIEKYNSPNLSKVFSGHTIMTTPVQIGKCINIDTGAYGSGRNLTVYDVTNDIFYQVNEFPGEGLNIVEPYKY